MNTRTEDGGCWTRVAIDRYEDVTISTYERQFPHGSLVLVVTECGGSVEAPMGTSLVFVPAAPHPGQERL